MRWRSASLGNCRLFQLHGACDTTFRAADSKADVFMLNAGHLLTVTHSEQVNEILRVVFVRGACD